jgi:antitoxin component of MazEF toxin-antitoxin module
MASHVTKLRKVGGSVMFPVPPEILDELGWSAGIKVRLVVEGEKLIVAKRGAPQLAFETRDASMTNSSCAKASF